jgi:hypothetical protein
MRGDRLKIKASLTRFTAPPTLGLCAALVLLLLNLAFTGQAVAGHWKLGALSGNPLAGAQAPSGAGK